MDRRCLSSQSYLKHRGRLPADDCVVDALVALVVGGVDLGARAEEEVCDLEVALVRGHHQRRLPLAAGFHQASVVADQGPHHRDLALLGRGLH